MANSLIAKGRIGKHGGHGWQSRDTKDVDCQATGCLFNLLNKCRVPTNCKIGPDGRCEGFTAKTLPKVKDGD